MNEELAPLHTKADEIMDMLLDSKELSVKDIAKQIEQSESYVRHIANVLEKNGLITVDVTSLKMTLKLKEFKAEEEKTDEFHDKAKELVHSLVKDNDDKNAKKQSKTTKKKK